MPKGRSPVAQPAGKTQPNDGDTARVDCTRRVLNIEGVRPRVHGTNTQESETPPGRAKPALDSRKAAGALPAFGALFVSRQDRDLS